MTAGTIYALSSAPGRAGIAVVRLSGPEAAEAVLALTGREVPKPRTASLRRAREFSEAQQDGAPQRVNGAVVGLEFVGGIDQVLAGTLQSRRLIDGPGKIILRQHTPQAIATNH